MRKWIESKKNRIALLLAGTQILLIIYFIVPAHNKISYYKEKAESSRRESEQMKKYSFYLDYHKKNLSAAAEKLEFLKTQTLQNADIAFLQSQLEKAGRKLNLTVLSQKIESPESGELYDKIIVRQTLQGKYAEQMRYIKSLSSLNPLMLLSECVYESADPLRPDPNLLTSLEFIYLIPKY